MEPYREDEPWIRFNPEAMKQSILETILSIPGARAIKYYHDNPEGSAAEFVDLLAEDVIPEYRNLIKPALTGEDIDWEDAVKEAAIYGIPMPYIRHPKTGEAIPNNLKEGLGTKIYGNTRSYWKNSIKKADALNAAIESGNPIAISAAEEAFNKAAKANRKLYYNIDDVPEIKANKEGLSTVSRIDRTYEAQPSVDIPAGPYLRTNTGSTVQSRGRTANATNTVATTRYRDANPETMGARSWQGDMYPPNRTLRKDDMYGPFQWEDKYSRKLNDAIDENEYKWEYLINKTRPARISSVVTPKEDIIQIALTQGRPDIAARVVSDNKARISMEPRTPGYDPRFQAYKNAQRGPFKDNVVWKDNGNRIVEKDLRETFATLPEDPDIRFRFADYYGTPDLYNDWLANPDYWKVFKEQTLYNRRKRENSNRSNDRRFGRNIQR